MISFLMAALLLFSPFWSSEVFIPFPDHHPEIVSTNNSKPSFTGQWEGTATTSNEVTRLILDISEQGTDISATITLMDMGVMGWPARTAELNNGVLTLVFPTDNSQQILILRKSETNTIVGEWEDTNLEEKASVQLKNASANKGINSKQLMIEGPAGELSAELILPNGKGPFPGVVFLHGSGPQPKDASRFAAYVLAKEGIASVIFDKRGVGGSEGEWQGADFYQLAQDGVAVATYMSGLEEISAVGFFGHSQGGWIGPLAATKWKSSAFVISSAGPAVSPAREAHWGFIYNVKNAGGTKEDISLVRRVVEGWHEGLRDGVWSNYKKQIELAKEKDWFEASGLSYLQYPPDPDHNKYYLPFMDYDPIPALLELNIPLLSILTTNDESIDTRETESILRMLKKEGKDIRIKMYEGYNHGFRKIGSEGSIRWPGFPEDYYILQAAFIKEVTAS